MPEVDTTVEYRSVSCLPEAFYRVGSDGSVWGCQKRGVGAGKVGRWRKLKEILVGVGYRGVSVGVAGVAKRFYIHHLVLLAFAGPCPKEMECCHGDGDRTNNRVDNLRWGTRADNVADKFKHRTQPMGDRIPWAKLTEANIPVIRTRMSSGESATVIADDYGVDAETVRDVFKRRTWKHV